VRGVTLAVALVTSVVALESQLANRYPESAVHRQLRTITTAPQPPRVLLLGDSHAAFGVHADQLPADWAVVAMPSQNWIQRYLIARHLCDRYAITDVIIPLALHTLAFHEGDEQFEDMLMFGGLRRIAELYEAPISEIAGAWLRARNEIWHHRKRRHYVHARILDWCGASIGRFRGTAARGSAFDRQGRYSHQNRASWQNCSAAQREADLRVHEKIDNYKVFPAYAAAATEFLAFCEKNGITVVGIRFPVTREYREREYTQAPGVEVQAIAGGCVATLDYTMLFEGNEAVFSDAHHLNADGAALLTRRLPADLNQFPAVTP
jgi:hypothetical protein